MKYIIKIILPIVCVLSSQTIEQIEAAKKIIKESGMSEAQVRDEAKKRGYSEKQIDEMKDKILKDAPSEAPPKIDDIILLPELEESIEIKKLEAITIFDEPEEYKEELVSFESKPDFILEDSEDAGVLPYFGYDIFKQDPGIFQSSSVGAVDPDYLIGPGDEVIVMLWGETEFRQLLSVDREGFVFIPEIGQVFVNGLNLNLLESKLFRVFSQSYASLNPEGRKPTTFLDVSLGILRPLRVQVLGEVAQPGAYTVSPTATLFSALYYFGGPTTLGSLRDIHLIRAGKKIASIDFYDYLLTGKKPKDQKLQLDDVIFIPSRLKTVSIDGQINRKGIYEVKPNETLTDLIKFAGNLKATAYMERLQIDRIVPFEDRDSLGMDRMYTDVNLGQVLKSEEGFELVDGDSINIFSVFDSRQNAVEIVGPVSRPGNYDLGASLKLSELIIKADGLLGSAYMKRVDIIRNRPDFTEELIKLDLEEVIKGNPKYDIPLKGLDRVKIFDMREMVPNKFVSISGHVKRPGRYLLQENMTVYDLIFLAGGYADEGYKNRTYLKRSDFIRKKENSDEKILMPFSLDLVLNEEGIADTLLKPDDRIKIYSVYEIEGGPRYVTISGHVKRPGDYELFENNMTLHDLLFQAGGFDDPSYKSKTFLDRADLIRFEKDLFNKIIIPFHLGNVLSNTDDEQNFILLPEDKIQVYPNTVFNTTNTVIIKGVVRLPGSYELKNNMTIKDLILEAGGLNEDVFRYRVEVARINPNNNNLSEYAKVVTFNIDEKFTISSADNSGYSIKKDSASKFLLQPYDMISIRTDPYFSYQKTVVIEGEVLYPGEYAILSSDEKITDIINRAGGLLPGAYPLASEYTRNGVKINISMDKIIQNPRSKLNFDVQDGDLITILPTPNIIRVLGEVNKPGVHKYVPGRRLKYYVDLAGGLNSDADYENIWIEYPNGDSKPYHYYPKLKGHYPFIQWTILSPRIPDGSSIVIAKAKESEPFDPTEFAKELTGIIANLAQAIAVIMLAAR